MSYPRDSDLSMYRLSEYLHLPEIAIAALQDRMHHKIPASRIDYGPTPHQRAYFLRPRVGLSHSDSATITKPLVIFIHGGGWRRGHPKFFRFVGRFFARNGYPCLLLGYRLGPKSQFTEQLTDIQRGIAAFKERLADDTALPERAVIIGQSAGGHLGAHLAFRAGISPIAIAGFISISGVLSFERTTFPYLERLIPNTARDAETKRIADPRAALAGQSFSWLPEASEVARGRRGSVPVDDRGTEERKDDDRQPNNTTSIPTLLVQGMEDRIVPVELAISFCESYRKLRGQWPSLLLLPWAKHNELALVFLARRPRVSALVLGWLEAVSRTW